MSVHRFILSVLAPIAFFLPTIVLADTTVLYPTFDGYLYKQNSNNWATTRDATNAEGVSSTDTAEAVVDAGKTGGGNFAIIRSAFCFDDTGDDIPSDAIIDSITFSVYATSVLNGDNDGQDYLVIVQSTQSTFDNLTTADYDQIGATSFSNTIDITGKTALQYYEFVLNSAGLSHLNSTTSPLLAIQEGHDFENSAPVADNMFEVYSAYLEITFDSPPDEETPVATSTTNIDWQDDLSKIVAWEFTYDGTNTDATTSVKMIVYDLPILIWLLIGLPILVIMSSLIIEYKIRLRQWTTH